MLFSGIRRRRTATLSPRLTASPTESWSGTLGQITASVVGKHTLNRYILRLCDPFIFLYTIYIRHRVDFIGISH